MPRAIIIVRSVKPRYNEKSRARDVKKSNCFSPQSPDIVSLYLSRRTSELSPGRPGFCSILGNVEMFLAGSAAGNCWLWQNILTWENFPSLKINTFRWNHLLFDGSHFGKSKRFSIKDKLNYFFSAEVILIFLFVETSHQSVSESVNSSNLGK